jgi:cytochrome b561
MAAKVFHWVMFVLVGIMFPLGYVMADMTLSPQKLQVFSWHKSIGVLLLLLAVLRLGWRLIHAPPAPPEAAAWYERIAADGVHTLLYACLFALPLSGWLMSSAAGLPVVVFRVGQLPDLIAANEANRLVLFEIHRSVGFFLLALLCVHVAASLFHHYVRKDDVLVRMLPFKARKETQS